jgi:hypothetical protein
MWQDANAVGSNKQWCIMAVQAAYQRLAPKRVRERVHVLKRAEM